MASVSRSRRLPQANVEVTVPVTVFVLVVLVFFFAPGLYGQEFNSFDIFNAFQGFAPIGLVSLALGLTLLAGEFDLSVLGMQAFGGVVAVKAGASSGLLGVLAAVAVCALLGALQGGVIARLRIPSMPVTLGTYIAMLGLTNVLAGDKILSFANTGASIWVDQTVASWFSPRSLVTLGAFALAFLVLAGTRIGPELRTIGSDRRAGRVTGVPVDRRLIVLFAVSAALCGCAGALLAYSNASAALNPGLQPLILAAAAVVLGGTSLSGGHGTVWGLLLGAIAVALIQQTFAILALPSSTEQIVFGALLLVVVAIDAPGLRATIRRLQARRVTFSASDGRDGPRDVSP